MYYDNRSSKARLREPIGWPLRRASDFAHARTDEDSQEGITRAQSVRAVSPRWKESERESRKEDAALERGGPSVEAAKPFYLRNAGVSVLEQEGR
jgi:hypothetical protein